MGTPRFNRGDCRSIIPLSIHFLTFLALMTALPPTLSGCETSSESATPDPHPQDDVLRMNHIQVKGTHNSYHIEPEIAGPPWQYTHAPLDVQLGTQGVRQFELDVHFDEDTGVFAVHHVPVVDAKTTCADLKTCLTLVDTWSIAHPDHVPIWIWIEPKNTATQLTGWDGLQKLEDRIRDVLPDDRRISPDDVRGDHPTLLAAVAADGWPTLRVARGRIVMVLLDSGAVRDDYVAGNNALKGKVLFAEGKATDSWGVVAKIDGPKGAGGKAIGEAVGLRRIIRTRADSTDEPRAGDTSRRDAAFASGAHMVSTDYPAPVASPAGYHVEVPGGDPVRCNPVGAPTSCNANGLAGVGL